MYESYPKHTPKAVRTGIVGYSLGPELLIWWSTHLTDSHSSAKALNMEPALKPQATEGNLNISLNASD